MHSVPTFLASAGNLTASARPLIRNRSQAQPRVGHRSTPELGNSDAMTVEDVVSPFL